ncbi:HET-domain-containing protein [Cadophora sp. DSE1049]|nr:HET-domain-containing protein [Cadophora sp. DSE1049]
MTDNRAAPAESTGLPVASGNGDWFLEELEKLMGREFFGIAPEHSSRRYTYEQLPDQGLIRLLTLEAGSSTDALRGSLSQAHVDSLPKYEALSYCWGSPEKPCSIDFDGGSIFITQSLYSALVRLRRRHRSRLIWADALCINQDDNLEKNQQIMLMPHIYSSAFRTLAYLGDEADNSDAALRLHEKIGETSFSALQEKYVTIEFLEAAGLPPYQDPQWLALQTFWRRPWFRRAWVLQEFILGKDIVIMCGRKKMSWKKFIGATTKMQEFNLLKWSTSAKDTYESIDESDSGATSMLAMVGVKSSSNLGSGLAYYVRSFSQADASTLYQLEAHKSMTDKLPFLKDTIMLLRQKPELVEPVVQFLENVMGAFGLNELSEVTRNSIIHLLLMFDRSEATDPRDRLFALLGLASIDGNDEEFRPDYNESVESVTQRFTMGFIQKGDGMKSLHLAGLLGHPSSMPSWVPDWTRPGLMQRRILCARTLWAPSTSYSAATELLPSMKFNSEPGVLAISGSRMDTISRVGMDASGVGSRESPDIFILTRFFAEADDIIRPDSETIYQATGETMHEVFWRTIIGNKAMNAAEAPEDYGHQYQQCRHFFDDNTRALASIEQVLSLNLYYGCLGSILLSYRLCATQNGLFGLVPLSTQVGDTVCLFHGAAMPFVIRPSADKEAFQLVGGCYVHGLMKGEALRSPLWKEEEISLH